MGKAKNFTKKTVRTGLGTAKKYTKNAINATVRGAKLLYKKMK
jgi:hypothetical protein